MEAGAAPHRDKQGISRCQWSPPFGAWRQPHKVGPSLTTLRPMATPPWPVAAQHHMQVVHSQQCRPASCRRLQLGFPTILGPCLTGATPTPGMPAMAWMPVGVPPLPWGSKQQVMEWCPLVFPLWPLGSCRRMRARKCMFRVIACLPCLMGLAWVLVLVCLVDPCPLVSVLVVCQVSQDSPWDLEIMELPPLWGKAHCRSPLCNHPPCTGTQALGRWRGSPVLWTISPLLPVALAPFSAPCNLLQVADLSMTQEGVILKVIFIDSCITLLSCMRMSRTKICGWGWGNRLCIWLHSGHRTKMPAFVILCFRTNISKLIFFF